MIKVLTLPKKPTYRKYRNKITIVDGRKFDSKAEADTYLKLKSLGEFGQIKKLTLQPKYPITVNGKKVCSYIGDFLVHWSDGRVELWDVKGMKTPVYNLKKKLVKAIYGIDIIEIKP